MGDLRERHVGEALSIGDSARTVIDRCDSRTGIVPRDSMAPEQGGGDLWGRLAERLECARERPVSFPVLKNPFNGQARPRVVVP